MWFTGISEASDRQLYSTISDYGQFEMTIFWQQLFYNSLFQRQFLTM